MDRRAFLGTAVAGSALAATARAQTQPGAPQEAVSPKPAPTAPQLPPPRAVPQAPTPTLTPALARFVSATGYASLPPEVVLAAKRYLIDAIGCALAGHLLPKGKHVTAVMATLGGTGARILGTGQRASVAAAGFANGELVNALDYDGLPHYQPYIAPAALAAAESRRAPGKALILATAIGNEIAVRTSTLPLTMGKTVSDTGLTPDLFGNSNEAIIGAAAAAANVLGLDQNQTENALGLSVYYCTLASARTWELRDAKPMCKYAQIGPSVENAIIAALLAQSGYTGDPGAMDHPLAFPFIYVHEQWDPARVVRQLGEKWAIPTMTYKPYAACRFIHSQIDLLAKLRAENGFSAGQVESIHSKCFPFLAKPDMMHVASAEDAQFSTPYMLALTAMGVPIDARCQDMRYIQSSEVRAMMDKISWEWTLGPASARSGPEGRQNFYCEIEVKAGGKSFSGVGGNPSRLTTDAQIADKFMANALTILPKARAERALDMLWKLETLPDTRSLVDQLVLA